MDRAKYRGLRTDGQGWVYGCLVVKHGIPYILTTFRISKYSKKIGYSEIEVIPETVGQLWKPSLGIEVFGGDLVEAICAPSGNNSRKVRKCKIIDSNTGFSMAVWHKGEWWAYSSMDFTSIKIIGNIHESEASNG